MLTLNTHRSCIFFKIVVSEYCWKDAAIYFVREEINPDVPSLKATNNMKRINYKNLIFHLAKSKRQFFDEKDCLNLSRSVHCQSKMEY